MKLLFVPGSACGVKTFVCQTPHFTGSEAVSLPGHPEGKPLPGVGDYVTWLRGHLTDLGYRDVIMAGHSMGGAVALLYAIRYADLKGLILLNTGARLRLGPDLLAAAAAMGDDDKLWQQFLAERHRSTVPEAREAIIAERRQIGPAVLLNDYRACNEFDVMNEVSQIKIPTLVVGGTDDELTPVKYTRYLADHIEGAVEVIVPDAGHWTITEKPAAVNRAIADFLASLR